MTTKREIARRWMATESFEWTAGMLAHDHRDRFWRLCADRNGNLVGITEGSSLRAGDWIDDTVEWTGEWVDLIDAMPVLTDKATLGILLLTSMTELPSMIDVEKIVAILEDSS